MRHQPESAKALRGTRLASSGKANVNDEEEKKQGEGKGFAGLSSMVSDVDDVVSSKPKQPQKPHSEPHPKQTAGGSQQPKQTSTKPTSQTYQAPAQPSGGSSAGKWFVGIAVVIGLIWLANQSDNSRPSKSGYSPGSSSTSTAPASQPVIAQPQAPSRPSESKPSVGRNNVLSTAQIRYCLAEKIRLDAAEAVINNYSDSDVDRFNGYVNDYNSRCGEFRYRQGALESARRDVDPYRSQLQAEGRNRFVRSPATTARTQESTPASKPSRPTPDATVLAIQRRLNELGYNAGTPDGLFGNKTRAAIQAFQGDNGITVDGVASSKLLALLELAQAVSGSSNNSAPKQNAALGGNVAPPRANSQSEPTRDQRNYNKCIDGRYPALCDHTLLTPSEAARVDAAERRANFEKCIDGRYPALCNHSLLTQSEAVRVDAAERKANFDKCIDGRYPALCDHSRLSSQEASLVRDAERRAGRSY
ncbi:MAG: peptidoglycan-binding protein [Gammaproteobacteria bacterium]|nr:peptidoglycan-binding protein [Gammaproteobacteria bacterium]